MKEYKNFNKTINSRLEEEREIKSYIDKYSDISPVESEELSKNLDFKTIEAFEEAMDKVAQEYDREKSKGEILVESIRKLNKKEEVATIEKLLSDESLNLNREEIEKYIFNKDIYEDLETIEIIKGKKGLYIFDSTLWTRQFAMTAVILEEKDILEAIAQRTRKDCKIYPRPLQVSALKNPPYTYSDEEIFKALDKMSSDENYKDIKTVKASNEGVCIYSEEHMSEKYAKALCEELEVLWKKQQ